MIPNGKTFALAFFAFAVQAGPGEPPSTSTINLAAPPLTVLPPVRLGPIGESADVAAYLRAVTNRVDGLVRQAEDATEPMTRVGFFLAAANQILAYQLEPACTCEFLGIADRQVAADEDKLRPALDRADALLGKAQNELTTISKETEPPGNHLRESEYRLETLQAFAGALRAYLLGRKDPGPGGELPAAPGPSGTASARRAALQLSVLLEDPHHQVAAAAALWQACLRSGAPDLTRVMSLLPPALSDPPAQDLPFAFFSKLLRCRLLASSGGHAAALALAVQIEDRCDDWLSDEAERADAVRAATLIEIQILSDWHQHLAVSNQAEAQQWCAQRINTLIEERFPEGKRTVLRLTSAIPVIAPPPPPAHLLPNKTPDSNRETP